jgi:hypothetical protein
MFYRILNYVGFQVGWFASIGGAASGMSLLGPIVMGLVLALQVFLAPDRKKEAALLIAAGAIGWVADSSLVLSGVLAFPAGSAGWPCPLWMVVMWMGLAGTLHGSMAWLSGRYSRAVLFGAVGGPLAYAAGVRAGAASFGVPAGVALSVVAVEWALAMPVLGWLAQLTRADRENDLTHAAAGGTADGGAR